MKKTQEDLDILRAIGRRGGPVGGGGVETVGGKVPCVQGPVGPHGHMLPHTCEYRE